MTREVPKIGSFSAYGLMRTAHVVFSPRRSDRGLVEHEVLMERIGLVAGNGQFPILFAENARHQGFEVVAVAHRGETSEGIADVVSGVTWVYPGELEKLI